MKKDSDRAFPKRRSRDPERKQLIMSLIAAQEPGGAAAREAFLAQQKQLGAFYTPQMAAEVLADWALRADGDRVLEPSSGDGVFLAAMKEVERLRGLCDVRTVGIEISTEAMNHVKQAGLLDEDNAIRADFLSVHPFEVDAVVGNPPYVRMRHLPEEQRRSAFAVAASTLGNGRMDPSGSLWMPFVLHSMRFLREGGRMALVLPYDFTYVRYARPLWRRLRESFGDLRIARVRERLFPNILQEVVLLFADDYGASTDHVVFEAYESVSTFASHSPVSASRVTSEQVESGARPFVEALLSPELRDLLGRKLKGLTREMRQVARFGIGYVAGDKAFFHPTPETRASYSLRSDSFRPAVTSARQLRGVGLGTTGIEQSKMSLLFSPNQDRVGAGEARYISAGEEAKVNERYKCRVRSPWWKVPGVATPDLLATVFSEYPLMVANDARLVASNSLLCGNLHAGYTSEEVLAGWYTPLTKLFTELAVHSLGGGVFVLVPNEMGSIRLPVGRVPAAALAELDAIVRSGDMNTADDWGREHVLRRLLGLSDAEITLIDEGVETLARWRKGAKAGSIGSRDTTG